MGRTKAERESGIDRRKAPPFTPEQIDAARRYLGRLQYQSSAVNALTRKFGLPVKRAYLLINEARKQTINEMLATGKAEDPLTAQFLFLQSIVGDESEDTKDRLNASKQLVQLLGLEKLLGDDSEVEKYLQQLAAKRLQPNPKGTPNAG